MYKIIKLLSKLVTGVSVFMLIGLVGGLDTESITLAEFDRYSILFLFIFALSLTPHVIEKVRGKHGTRETF